jgi:hypothetical protein
LAGSEYVLLFFEESKLLYETTRSDVVDGVAAVDMAATEDITAGKGINEVMTRAKEER